jgi:hypothetical protein
MEASTKLLSYSLTVEVDRSRLKVSSHNILTAKTYCVSIKLSGLGASAGIKPGYQATVNNYFEVSLL